MNSSTRRDFLRLSAAGLALAELQGSAILSAQEPSPAGIPTRPLGDTGERVSIVGLGGYHIGTVDEPQAIRMMHRAIDEGMTFFDNSWDYHDGASEEVMGKALQGEWRDKAFLMTKVCDRDYEGAKRHLEDSLRRLQTDRIDLWQFHEINYEDDPDWLFDKGAIRAAEEAKAEGKVRYVGFTGHKDWKLHLELIKKPFKWDAVQMPINILDANYESFQKNILPVCEEKKIGPIGMKALAGGQLVRGAGLDPVLCRKFALSLPISTLVCGIQSEANLEQDLKLARGFEPLSEDELNEFITRTAELAEDGKHEMFKSTRRFDGGYHRRQHGV